MALKLPTTLLLTGPLFAGCGDPKGLEEGSRCPSGVVAYTATRAWNDFESFQALDLEDGDVVHLCAGTFSSSEGNRLWFHPTDWPRHRALSIMGAGIDKTILDEGSLYRVFDIMGASVTISDLTVRGGGNEGYSCEEPCSSEDALDGGGFRISGYSHRDEVGIAEVLLERVAVEHNEASYGGGAYLGWGQLTLRDSFVRYNRASSSNGAVALSSEYSSLVSENTVWEGNSGHDVVFMEWTGEGYVVSDTFDADALSFTCEYESRSCE